MHILVALVEMMTYFTICQIYVTIPMLRRRRMQAAKVSVSTLCDRFCGFNRPDSQCYIHIELLSNL